MKRRSNALPAVAATLLLSSLACVILERATPTPTTMPSPTRPPAAATRETPPRTSITEATPTELPSAGPTATIVWQPSQPPGPPHFKDGQKIKLTEIYMSNRDQGWGISGPFVFVTDDGGNRWREVTPPHPGVSASDTRAYAAFDGATVAWVIFSDGKQFPPEVTIWHTLTTGSAWTPSWPVYQEVYGDALWADLAAGDAAHVWMALQGVYVGAGTHYVTQFFRTVDAGVSWEPLDADVGVAYTGMEFADEQTGWLTWETVGAYAEGPPEYAVTSDGGLHWEVRDLPAPGDAPTLFDDVWYSEPYAPTYLAPTSMRLLVEAYDFMDPGRGNPLPDKTHSGFLYSSDDGGASWRINRLPDDVFAPHYDLVFFDAQSALLLGREIYRTTDGGLTWEHVKTVNWDGQFSFVDSSYGWAVATSGDQSALVRTTDGGRTWAEVDPRVTR